MSRFTPQAIEYLQSQRLARLATIGANGDLHVVPFTPTHIISLGINEAVVMPGQGKVNYSSRKVA